MIRNRVSLSLQETRIQKLATLPILFVARTLGILIDEFHTNI